MGPPGGEMRLKRDKKSIKDGGIESNDATMRRCRNHPEKLQLTAEESKV
jgi:hypothetical protein